jgi:uncharacterized membrane protein
MATGVIAAGEARTAVRASGARISSIDILRGAVMVLMAIDHVRVYSGVPPGGPTAGVFFTRWVTHFCAPAFAFFAGTSAFLLGRKLADTGALARYLITRGAVLIALELTLLHIAWTFSIDFSNLLFGVIWMLGACMILLAALVRFSPRAIGTFGLILVAAQQIFRIAPALLPAGARAATMPLWRLLYLGGPVTVVPNRLAVTVLYNIVPWIGVMAAGYGFGAIVVRDAEARRRACLRIGLAATALFLLLGGAAAMLTDGSSEAPFVFRLLDQSKYRDSQLFLLMTLGPTIALLPYAERARGWLASVLATFGRVPLFYYLLHIPLIHTVSLLVWYLRDGTSHADWFLSAPFVSTPDGQQWPLSVLYAVFFACVAILYVPCRWFAQVKARGGPRWVRYV